MHLVIASRVDPPLALAQLRARGQLTELRASHLRFTPDEASTFLNQAMGLNLSPEAVVALEARTEGWIAGLQLAALSMRDCEDVQGFIQAFTGSHRFILDYLTEQVLQRQPEIIQTFLLQTSILNGMTGPLCDAVTGRNDGQTMLEQLEAANLFIVPLDEERRWYRYHHLFADLLRVRIRQWRPGLVATLHLRADALSLASEPEHIVLARVLVAQGELDKAVGLLTRLVEAAEAGGRMGRLIEILVLQALALQAQARSARALTVLKKALLLAEPEGYIRIFADEGAPMAALLKLGIKRQVWSDDGLAEYVNKILRLGFGIAEVGLKTDRLQTSLGTPCASAESHGQAQPTSARDRAPEIIEPLSVRERQVLWLMAEGLSNREIAQELTLTVGTVKSHIHTIYGKLGAKNRAQAIARARGLNLL